MVNQLSSIIYGLVPKKVLGIARNNFRLLELNRTRAIFEKARPFSSSLGISTLAALQKQHSQPQEYRYDKESLERRGSARAREILRLQGARKSQRFLEVGCWDGMVSCALRRRGKRVTAVDRRAEGFDERALHEGVDFFQMDAAGLQFADESFDFVFSYDTFEHFEQPEEVFCELTRVTKRGGYIFLAFGPLYFSPFGEHAYRSITVPYCQILFSEETINLFTNQNGLSPIDFSHVNRWSLNDYQNLWKKYKYVLKMVKYNEYVDLKHLSLIRTYPSLFKSKSDNFSNFVVSSLEVFFKKIG